MARRSELKCGALAVDSTGMTDDKGSKMYGGLIKKQPRITKDARGHVTTEHFDGHQDVTINANHVKVLARSKTVGGDT
jgi:hypothetical protein